MHKRDQSGFAHLFIVLVILVVVVASGLLVWKHLGKKPNTNNSPTGQGSSQHSIQYLSDTAIRTDTCKQQDNAMFTHDFTEVSKLKLIEPPVIDGNNIRDRSWPAIDTSKTDKVAIYAPADVQVTSGVYKVAHEGENYYDYDFWFQLSCDRWFFINHISDPVDKLKHLLPDKPITSGANGASPTANRTDINPPVSFKAGELLGYTTGTGGPHNFDLGVFDQKHKNVLPAGSGYDNGDNREQHFICSFDLFPANIKAQYYSLLSASQHETGSVCPQ